MWPARDHKDVAHSHTPDLTYLKISKKLPAER